MAAATGYPIEIPILTRSLVASIGPITNGFLPLALSFKLLQVLDAGTSSTDPSALVREYACDWWLGTAPPLESQVLGINNIDYCLGLHRKQRKDEPIVTTFEKPAYTWGRGLYETPAEPSTCEKCQPMRAIVTAATDELRELRLIVDSLETHFDVERELANRSAGGAHALFSSAALKETEAGQLLTDAVTGHQQQVPQVPPAHIPGTIRQPKKGPEVVKRVRRAAKVELAEFQTRPNMKWTSGVDLDEKDLQDLLGSRYNERLEGSHSGYDTDLPHGTISGHDSPSPGPMGLNPFFDELSRDVIDPPELSPSEIPTEFYHHPLRQSGDQPDTLLARVLDLKIRQNTRRRRRGKEEVQIPMRPATPDQDPTSFTVPAASDAISALAIRLKQISSMQPDTPAAHKNPAGGRQATYQQRPRPLEQSGHVENTRADAPLASPILGSDAGADATLSTPALRGLDPATITLPLGYPLPALWDTPMSETNPVHPPTSDISDEMLNIGSSPTTEWVNRRRRTNIFLSSDGERHIPAGHVNLVGEEPEHTFDVETLAAAWDSDDDQPALPIDVGALADAYASSSPASESDDDQPALPIDVGALADAYASSSAASESDDHQPVLKVDVEALAEAYRSSPECSEPEDDQPALRIDVNALAEAYEADSVSGEIDVAALAAAWDSDVDMPASPVSKIYFRL
jgi:hypothetical protein